MSTAADPIRILFWHPSRYWPQSGLLTLQRGQCVRDYYVRRLDTDFGQGWEMERFVEDGEVYAASYHVLLDDEGQYTCECDGFLRWQTWCKHIRALLELRERGFERPILPELAPPWPCRVSEQPADVPF